MRIRFTADAVGDLDELKQWLRLKNPRSYTKIAKAIAKTIRPLSSHPFMGRTTLREDIREVVEPRYGFIIPYSMVEDTIFILRVYSVKRYPLPFTRPSHPVVSDG